MVGTEVEEEAGEGRHRAASGMGTGAGLQPAGQIGKEFEGPRRVDFDLHLDRVGGRAGGTGGTRRESVCPAYALGTCFGSTSLGPGSR